MPEDKVSSIKPGMTMKVRGRAQDAQTAPSVGTVREVSASADPVTRTYLIKLALSSVAAPPPLGATVVVLPEGMGGVQGMPVIKLPTSALRRDGQNSAVWVPDKASMTIKPQTVQIATADGNEAVVAAGLQPGMLVVIAGVHVLSPGQKVTIYRGKAPVAHEIPAQTAINPIANDTAAAKLAAPGTAGPASSPAK